MYGWANRKQDLASQKKIIVSVWTGQPQKQNKQTKNKTKLPSVRGPGLNFHWRPILPRQKTSHKHKHHQRAVHRIATIPFQE